MEENVKQIIKSILLKTLKSILIAGVPIIAILVIISLAFYYFTIDEGVWDNDENSPRSYKNNVTITGNGVKVDTIAILKDALRNAGYTDEQIQQIESDLQNQGYSGEELEKKFAQKALELLGIEGITNVSGISAAELIWNLNQDMYSKYLDNYEQLQYLMNAELVTQMPHLTSLEGTNDLNGTIYFERCTENNNKTRLMYIGEALFDELVKNSDSSILQYFTITEDNRIKIAYYYQESGSISTNDATVNVADYDSRFTNDNPSFINSRYETRTISYSTMIPEIYSMPFEYLWAMLVMSEDYDFVKGLADLSYNSEIIITVYDNVTENTTVTTYDYTRQQKDYSQIEKENVTITREVTENAKASLTEGLMLKEDSRTSSSSNTLTEEEEELEKEYDVESYNITKTIYTYTNLLEIKLTYADVWVAEYKTEYNYYTQGNKYADGVQPYSDETTKYGTKTENEISGSKKTNQFIKSAQPSTNIVQDTWIVVERVSQGNNIEKPMQLETSETIEKDYEGDKWSTIETSETTINEKNYLYTTKYINNPDSTVIREKTNIEGELNESGQKIAENFCSLFASLRKQEYILDNVSWLSEIMENNQETADMVDLTKYLLNKVTGSTKYRVTFDFSIFDPSTFSPIGGGGNLSVRGTSLTKEEFISLASAYNGDSDYRTYMVPYLEDFYDICTQYNVNPVIAFAHSCLETGYGSNSGCKNDKNYFGMGHYNDASNGAVYSTVAESIENYCMWVVNHSTVGTSEYASTYAKAQQYATVNDKLNGTPDTNIYVLYCTYAYLGNTHCCDEPDFDNPKGTNWYYSNGSTWGTGGRIYIYEMYENGGLYSGEYKTRCGHSNASDPTTVSEQADYAVYTTNKRIQVAQEIFGNDVFWASGEEGSADVEGIIIATYTSSSGKTYKQYKQNEGSWATEPYGDKTIAQQGCSITSIAISLSGYGYEYTPSKWQSTSLRSIDGTIKQYAKSSKRVYIGAEGNANLTVEASNKSEIQQHLEGGDAVLIHVLGSEKKYNSSYTSNEHWMALLDINDDGSQVYVSNPNKNGANGWADIDDVLQSLCCYILVGQ